MIITKIFCKSGIGKCKNKPRYLGDVIGSGDVNNLICATCKYRNSFKIRVKEKKNVTTNGTS